MELKSSAGTDQAEQHFHVLAVDDSVLDRRLLERLLKFSSYQVTCVDSGDKALEYLGLLDKLDNTNPTVSSTQQRMKVNMIMTDYCMPGMTGYDLLKKVKDSSWKDIPVVVMSSENIPSRITKCFEEGADEFLLKPLQISDVEKLQSHLLKTLETSCNNKQEINSTNVAKRKAISAEPTERRTKIIGLAVL